MANITPTTIDNSDETRTVLWAAMGNADNGLSAAFGQFPDRTFGVTGTFGGATVILQGSFDGGTTWVTLNDYKGNAISFTAAGVALVAENPPLIRPSTSGGTGTVIAATLFGSRA